MIIQYINIIHIWPHIFMRNIPHDQCIWATKGVTHLTFTRFWCVVSCRLKSISLSVSFVKHIPQIKNYHQADVFFTCLLQGSKIDSWEHQSDPSLVHQPKKHLQIWGPRTTSPATTYTRITRTLKHKAKYKIIWSLNTTWIWMCMCVCVTTFSCHPHW